LTPTTLGCLSVSVPAIGRTLGRAVVWAVGDAQGRGGVRTAAPTGSLAAVSDDGRDLAEQFYRVMAASPDAVALAELYAPDALVIRFNGASAGFEEISTFLTDVRSRHRPYELHSIDQLARVGDVVMWDAVVNTDNGMLETTEVLVLDDGKIKRHIPGLRGYWGDD
jgi:hypothetical protein